MPCYQTITSSVVFKVENIDILKRALEAAGGRGISTIEGVRVNFYLVGTNYITIDLKNSKITSSMDEKELTTISNEIKRAYSLEVINEVARKQKWMKKKMGANQYQLQRF
jgi:hypothetical protein